MTFFFSSDYNPHTDRSTFYNSAQSTWPSPPKANFTPKGPPFHFLLFQGNIQNRTCPKGPPFGFFSELCDFFFENFQRSPLWVFWYFATECLLINPEGSPLLHFSALCDFFWKKIFFQKFQFFFKKSVLRFLSLRYGADFRRSRLVFFSFFFRLQSSRWSVHFLHFCAEHLRPSPPKANFTPKGPPFHFLLFQGNIQNRTCPKGPPFGFFSELCDFFSKIF